VPRILGVDIPKEKRIDVALTYLYGVGQHVSGLILAEAKIAPEKRAKDLTEDDVSHLTNVIQKMGLRVEGDLRREISQNVKRLMDIGTWRGYRHKRGLPVRGQRTRTNARTRKGPKRGNMAVVKKDTAKPQAKPVK
jgi:small subunit ribosomal protein S13